MKKGWFERDVSRLGEGHTETVTEVVLEDLDHQEIRQQKPFWQSQDTMQGPETLCEASVCRPSSDPLQTSQLGHSF